MAALSEKRFGTELSTGDRTGSSRLISGSELLLEVWLRYGGAASAGGNILMTVELRYDQHCLMQGV